MRIVFTGTRRGELVEIGRIVKPQGVKGELKIIPFAGPVPALAESAELFVLAADDTAPPVGYSLRTARWQGEALVVGLAGVTARDQAEALRDRVVALPADELPALAADEIYWHQLRGLVARTEDGREIGRVVDYLLTAAHPVLVIVDGQNREYLVPAHPEFMVPGYDRHGALAWLRLTPPPGLLEDRRAL